MRRLLSFVVVLLLSWTVVICAETNSIVESIPEVNTVDNPAQEGKGYLQLGGTLRYGAPYPYSHEEALVYACGYRFNRRNYVGLNVGIARANDGVEWYNGYQGAAYIGCPVSLDYTHYFPIGKKKKRHSIYLGAELGLIYSFGQSFFYHGSKYNEETGRYDYVEEEVSLGSPIIIIKAGMDHPIFEDFHLNWGFRLGILSAALSIGFTLPVF